VEDRATDPARWASIGLSGRNLASSCAGSCPTSTRRCAAAQVLQQAVQAASDGNFRLRVEQPGLEQLRAELRADARRRDLTLVGAATLLGGIVWLAVSFSPWPG